MNKTNEEKFGDEILERLLKSYPCKTCDSFKKYERELNGAKQNTQYTSVNNKFKEAINFVHNNFLHHIEDKHLPSEEEWKILSKL